MGEISGGPTILHSSEIPVVLVGSRDATLVCVKIFDGKFSGDMK